MKNLCLIKKKKSVYNWHAFRSKSMNDTAKAFKPTEIMEFTLMPKTIAPLCVAEKKKKQKPREFTLCIFSFKPKKSINK